MASRSSVSGRTALAAALLMSIVLACGGSSVPPPATEVPAVDASAIERLLEQAMADVNRLAASPPAIDLPADVSSLLDDAGIRLPAVPANAVEMCDALGTPGLAGATGAGLGAILEGLATGGEVGLAAALLTTVVFSTCPMWSPHLESALHELLGSP